MRLLVLSVPLVGAGPAAGIAGNAGRFDAVALTLSITSEIPAVQRRSAIKLRELMKPDFADDFFFMVGFVAYLDLFVYRAI